jgi:hypothetical protein
LSGQEFFRAAVSQASQQVAQVGRAVVVQQPLMLADTAQRRGIELRLTRRIVNSYVVATGLVKVGGW